MEYRRETRLGIRAEREWDLLLCYGNFLGLPCPRGGAAPMKGWRGGPGTQGVSLGDPIPPPSDQQLLGLQPGSPGPQDPPLSRAHRIRIYPPETCTTILSNQQKGVEPSFF